MGLFVLFAAQIATGQTLRKKNVFIITEMGPSHPAISLVMQQIAAGLQKTHPHDVDFCFERLDLLSFSSGPPLEETRDWLRRNTAVKN